MVCPVTHHMYMVCFSLLPYDVTKLLSSIAAAATALQPPPCYITSSPYTMLPTTFHGPVT